MKPDEQSEVWACTICGVHPRSGPLWCAAGCGRDYNEMVRVPLAAGVRVISVHDERLPYA